ncbi:MAG: M28 family peptidase [Candidatus Geothermarchaeales archaeon]
MIEEGYPRGLPRLSAADVYENLTNLCRIGTIWMGTRGEIQARNYIKDMMMRYGLQEVRLEDFEYLSYMPISSELIVTSPGEETIPCEPLEYSANATTEGEAVYVGTGRKEDFENLERHGVSLEGKIVLARSSTPFWITPLAEERGAAGLVIITDPPEDLIRRCTARIGHPPQRPPFDEYVANMPGVLTNAIGGDRLLSLLSAGRVRVRISQRGEYSTRRASNVVGVVPGSEMSEKKVLVGAHYDTQLVGGAKDDAVGVAGLLELARVMANLHPRRTVVFAAFAGEEIGLWGSTAYVEKHKDDVRENYVYMCNLDAISSSLTPLNNVWASPRIKDFALKVAAEQGWHVSIVVDLSSKLREFSDQCAFHEAGVPSTWIYESPNPYYHTEGDVLEHIDPHKSVKTLSVSGLLVFEAAYRSTLPF